MIVTVEFSTPPNDPIPDAVWIIDTPGNREWFNAHTGEIDANSAVFREDADPLTIIWAVMEHHPGWTEIGVRGVALTLDIEAGVKPEALARVLSRDAFLLTRLR